jgi:hypothetical protein
MRQLAAIRLERCRHWTFIALPKCELHRPRSSAVSVNYLPSSNITLSAATKLPRSVQPNFGQQPFILGAVIRSSVFGGFS